MAFFDTNGFRDRLAALVAAPSTSKDPGHKADVRRYLTEAIQPRLERLGFNVAITPTRTTASAPSLSPSASRNPCA